MAARGFTRKRQIGDDFHGSKKETSRNRRIAGEGEDYQ
jgi:hypothetical protein